MCVEQGCSSNSSLRWDLAARKSATERDVSFVKKEYTAAAAAAVWLFAHGDGGGVRDHNANLCRRASFLQALITIGFPVAREREFSFEFLCDTHRARYF